MEEIAPLLTPADLAKTFSISEADVITAFEDGTLKGVKIGPHWRISKEAVLSFINQGIAVPQATGSAAATTIVALSRSTRGVPSMESFQALSWEKKGSFEYLWPVTKADASSGNTAKSKETFEEAYQAELTLNGQKTPFVIAFCNRKAAGMENRRRAVIFKGELGKALYPQVEFAGANDFETSGVMASTIRVDGRKTLKPGEEVPDLYEGMPLGIYNEVVSGPNAVNGVAVVAQKTDFAVMLRHAVIRMLKAA